MSNALRKTLQTLSSSPANGKASFLALVTLVWISLGPTCMKFLIDWRQQSHRLIPWFADTFSASNDLLEYYYVSDLR